jgi:hypothetical protein
MSILPVKTVRFPLALIIPSHHVQTGNSASRGRRMTPLKSTTIVTEEEVSFEPRSTPLLRVPTFGSGVQMSNHCQEDLMMILKDLTACRATQEAYHIVLAHRLQAILIDQVVHGKE